MAADSGMKIERFSLQGINLVEASAGTGKTHTLSSLYLRLLLEQGLMPRSILVMTYTKAATAELKTRIRQRIVEARQWFQGSDTPDLLLQAIDQKVADRSLAIRQLDLALASFDRAAIFTIHGFCQRVLTEFAFESGQSFTTALVPDQAERLQQIADDFWRLEMSRLPKQFFSALQEWIATPDQLLARLKPALGKPYLRVSGAAWPDNLASLEQQAQQALQQLRACWSAEREQVKKLLSDKQVLKGYQANWLASWFEKMDLWLNDNLYEAPFDKVIRFTPEVIAEAVKKGKTAPENPFFNALADYLPISEQSVAAFHQAKVAWQARLYDYLQQELPRRQMEAGEWSYDDLLLQLHQALQADRSGQLCGLLRSRYRVALVDEFQDTDPIQYEILHRIYAESEQPLILVGDPKQAIYSFRGADIYTYLQARDGAGGRRHTLDTNWRSTPDMVQAINRLFSFSPRPFYDHRIGFQPTDAAERARDQLTEQGQPGAALQIWRLPAEEGMSVETLRHSVAETTAAEIASLLSADDSRQLRIGARRLVGSDIAILVRTHTQASSLAMALAAKGIASVRSSQQSVYWSAEAEALERVLIGLLEPHREAVLRAALATPLFGWSGAEIDRLNEDEPLQSQVTRQFFDHHQVWRSSGFMVMIRGLMTEFSMESRMLEYHDGERRLTNLYHLLELLQQHENSQRPGMEGLLKWFSQQRQSSAQDEERLLRLESDGDLVKIDTLHHSKGLEYGIVFCPYLWDESAEKRSDWPFLFHDPLDNDAAVLELGSTAMEQNRVYRQQENLAESIRLAYVALTRSRYRCYLPWGLTKQNRHGALCWLLHSRGTAQPPQQLSDWLSTAKGLQPSDDEAQLSALAASAGAAISVSPLPEFEVAGQLSLALPPELIPARRFSKTVPKHQQVASFSSLIAGLPEDLPDHDGIEANDSTPAEFDSRLDVHGFPRGAGPGSCLHAILENLDFQQNDQAGLQQLVEEKLLLYGIDLQWREVVVQWMQVLLTTPLNETGLHLGQIPASQRLNEMAFQFPVSAFNTRQISQLAERTRFSHAPGLIAGLGGLGRDSVDGYLKGYIDLVFEFQGQYFLADYKSNWLGIDYPAYHQQALTEAMASHHYPLQYVLYTLALHRYLRLRIPDYDYEKQFGGVFYLFLRGMRPQGEPGMGIVQERPPVEFINAMDEMIGEPP
ncbi:MAG: exodeoxyribonuclease V subunit beta [gamma proteobacterium symbiont of Stewartia floridana]|nr:MAG: exodeoxyribonuclease V subunit beta [gamma proteobacterium symbiont of Stewartia floridana]